MYIEAKIGSCLHVQYAIAYNLRKAAVYGLFFYPFDKNW